VTIAPLQAFLARGPHPAAAFLPGPWAWPGVGTGSRRLLGRFAGPLGISRTVLESADP